MTKFREPILNLVQKYYDQLNNEDYSHDFNHVLRVERLAKRIADAEGADIEIIEAACLIFDVARDLEDKGVVENHAEEGANIAKEVLINVDFPEHKIDAVQLFSG